MANLQSSGAIAISNIKTLFGGPTSPSLSNYYRGGSYIPATKVVSTIAYEPNSISPVNNIVPVFENGYWWIYSMYKGVWFIRNNGTSVIWWNDVQLIDGNVGGSSWTNGAYTYYAGSQSDSNFSTTCYCYLWYAYKIRRTTGGSETVSINTGIPSGGTIKLSQFYNAEKP